MLSDMIFKSIFDFRIFIPSLDDPAFNVIVAVLQALAGGTILYVVAFEILERERSKSVSGLVQLAFVIIGFSVLMAVELLGMNI